MQGSLKTNQLKEIRNMSIKTKLILSAVVAAFAMGSAFAAEEQPAADASAPAVKAVKKAHKKAAHKKAPKKAVKTEAEAPAAQ